jgi:hypothetical protein
MFWKLQWQLVFCTLWVIPSALWAQSVTPEVRQLMQELATEEGCTAHHQDVQSKLVEIAEHTEEYSPFYDPEVLNTALTLGGSAAALGLSQLTGQAVEQVIVSAARSYVDQQRVQLAWEALRRFENRRGAQIFLRTLQSRLQPLIEQRTARTLELQRAAAEGRLAGNPMLRRRLVLARAVARRAVERVLIEAEVARSTLFGDIGRAAARDWMLQAAGLRNSLAGQIARGYAPLWLRGATLALRGSVMLSVIAVEIALTPSPAGNGLSTYEESQAIRDPSRLARMSRYRACSYILGSSAVRGSFALWISRLNDQVLSIPAFEEEVRRGAESAGIPLEEVLSGFQEAQLSNWDRDFQ